MQVLATGLLIFYLMVIFAVCVYGLHRYWMLWTFLRHRRDDQAARPAERRFTSLPRVTVQLPMYNEKRVARRVIEAACAIDYPHELLQIQVLDDSTDESAAVARHTCQRMAELGHDVQYIRRTDRTGFKAGALEHGMKTATGEFIAVFDADFVPPPSILHDTIHEFTDARVGMVQTRWSHLNANDSLLTRVQALYLDGHFIVEQTARARSGRWFNFNGTAGIWRRSAIEDAGGWQHDTLTEDTDLSYRAQLRGWKFRYLPHVCCPAEIPPTVSAFLSQQHRWNKGLVQTGIKLLPTILRSDAPLRTKIEAWFHLTAPVMNLVVLLLVLLVAPAMFIGLPLHELGRAVAPIISTLFIVLGLLGAAMFYLSSQHWQGLSLWRTAATLPALMAMGVGISVANSRAVIEAILKRPSPFIRTPKYNGEAQSEPDPIANQRKRLIPNGVIETILGSLMIACSILSLGDASAIVALPFLILFAAGFISVGTPGLCDIIQKLRPKDPPAALAMSTTK